MKTLSNLIKTLIKIILKNYISNTVHELSFESCLDFKIGIYLISSYLILYMCIILLHSLFISTYCMVKILFKLKIINLFVHC